MIANLIISFPYSLQVFKVFLVCIGNGFFPASIAGFHNAFIMFLDDMFDVKKYADHGGNDQQVFPVRFKETASAGKKWCKGQGWEWHLKHQRPKLGQDIAGQTSSHGIEACGHGRNGSQDKQHKGGNQKDQWHGGFSFKDYASLCDTWPLAASNTGRTFFGWKFGNGQRLTAAILDMSKRMMFTALD